MIFWRTFLNSIQLPGRQAVFGLNRVGMDITVVYLFILLFFVSLPPSVDQLTTGAGTEMNWLFFLIYFFIFYYLPLIIIIFLLISFVAYVGTGIAKLLKRKLRFPLLWKMVAYTTTNPFLLYTILSLFIPFDDVFVGLFSLYVFLSMIKIITVYPRRKQRIQK
ncbi:DUF1189 family protein [Lentibacillus salicampi]|uniref:DUF1189 domain-containing protein n=1 Tax=Lentibacillus salicampi TaxID=175306 RepID=A0A4Y9AAB7_9BACI|nr:DUF1189 family protein [Lentibacillus salicampi]TFJ92272.1 DUF1189 domain-containing protein [Lentibacillus salicampi]